MACARRRRLTTPHGSAVPSLLDLLRAEPGECANNFARLAALTAAIEIRNPPAGCVHHSDRGSQHAAQAYRARLGHYRLVGSMGRRGNPYDNAMMESFMRTLKVEGVYPMAFESMEDVAEHLPRFIDSYNERRLHLALGYLSPNRFEEEQPRGSGSCPEPWCNTSGGSF